jgi:hypothetical protein
MKFLITAILFFISLNSFSQDCPEKVKWKKLKTEEEVKSILNSCLPLKTQKAEIVFFLKENKTIFSENEQGIIYASVFTRSKSPGIEKKW